MSKLKKSLVSLLLICLLSLVFQGVLVSAADSYINAQMFDTAPTVGDITAKYKTSLFNRGGGNQAMKIVAESGAANAMTMELGLNAANYSGTQYFEFYISVKGTGEFFEITPGIHDSQGWKGMNSAANVLFSEGEVGRYYVKPDGGAWELKEEGNKVTLKKGFAGLVRFPIACLTHNNVSHETNSPVELDKITAISNWYSLLSPGDEIVLDDFRFVKGDDSFYTPPAAPKPESTKPAESTPAPAASTQPSNPDDFFGDGASSEPTSSVANPDDFFGDSASSEPASTASAGDSSSKKDGGTNVLTIVLAVLFVLSLGGNIFLVYKFIVVPKTQKTDIEQ